MRILVATAADAPGVRAIYAPIVESTPTSFEVDVPSVSEMASRIRDRQPMHPWIVSEDAGSITGYAYAGRFASRPAYDWLVETSVYVAESARGSGIGKSLYEALFNVLTLQGYRRVMTGIVLPNAASVGLHESVGFSRVGVYSAMGWKLGAWHDVEWWQKGLGALENPPPVIVPITELAVAALHAALGARTPNPMRSSVN
jgi:phosphinothricin acetyltransferase